MSKPQTPQALSEAIRHSQILADEIGVVESCCEQAMSVTYAAKALMKKGLLSGWQANQLLGGATALRLGNVVLKDELPPWEAGRTFVGQDPKGRVLRIKLISGTLPDGIWEKIEAAVAQSDCRVKGCEQFKGAHQVGERQVLLSETRSGFDLKTYAERNELSLRQATKFLHQIGTALQRIHDDGRHHGLVMLEKVHVDEQHAIRLMDVEVAGILPFLEVDGPSPHAKSRRDQALKSKEDLGAKRSDWSMLAQLGLDLFEPIDDSEEKRRTLQRLEKSVKSGDFKLDQWSVPSADSASDADSATDSNSTTDSNFEVDSDSEVDFAADSETKPATLRPTFTLDLTTGRGRSDQVEDTAEKTEDSEAAPGKGQSTVVAKRKARNDDKQTEDEPVQTSDRASIPKSEMRSTNRMPVYIAVAVLGILLLGGGIYAGTQWFGDSEEIASAKDVKADEAKEVGDSAEADESEVDPTFDPETDPSLGGDSEDPGDTSPGTATDDSGDNDNATGNTTAPMPDGEEKPAEPKKTEPEPEPEPEPKKTEPEPEPKPVPKPVKPPFGKMATAVKLTPPEDGPVVQTIGMTDITDPSSVFASLRGGSSAIRGSDRFIMQNADMGTAIGKWEFNLVNRDDIPTTIATMELQGRKLVFQWRPEALDLKMAGQLHNCAISFTSGKFSHILALREVVEVPAPQVNLDRGIVSVTWDLPLPPDPDAIYVELAGVTGPLPNQKTVPQQPLNVTGDGQWILVGTPKSPVMSFLANWTVKRGIEVEFSTHLFPVNGVPRKSNASKSRLNKKVLTQERIRWTQEYVGLKRALDTKYSAAARNQVPAPLRANFDAAKAVMQRGYEQAQTTAVAVQKLVDLYPQIHEKSGLEFRVYHNADQTQVDLLRTSGYAAAKKSIKPGK